MHPKIEAAFTPSSVRCFFGGSVLQNLEQEVLAAHFVKFLEEQNDQWDAAVPLDSFMQFLQRDDQTGMPRSYMQPMLAPYARRLHQALLALASKGYLLLTEDDTVILMTQKFVDFCGCYRNEAIAA